MEWLALALWALTAAVALPAGSAALAAPPLGLVPPLALAGLALSVIFAMSGGDAAGLMWVAFGLAITAAATTGVGAAQLIAADESGGRESGRGGEHASAFAGLRWPFFLTTAGVCVLAAQAADGTL